MLRQRGIHSSYQDIERQFPIRDPRVLRHMKIVLSALANWSPIFADLPYLPNMVFPFVHFYGANIIGAFECTASFLMGWCSQWFETYPHPPITLLTTIDRLLDNHDPELRVSLQARELESRQYGWQMMRSLFTQVLTSREWLALMDCFMVHRDEPGLLIIAVVAYLIYFRAPILRAGGADSVLAFLRRQNPINIVEFIRLIFQIRAKTPESMLPQYSVAEGFPLPA